VSYARRAIDEGLDELMAGIGAIALEGPKAVGKTRTAFERARTVYRLDDPATRTAVLADPTVVTVGERPILIDEWQLVPPVWDVVRNTVDNQRVPGQFLLTGSVVPKEQPAHPGSARIISLEMHPMTFAERGLEVPTVHARDLIEGGRPALGGTSPLGTSDYAREVLASGFPGLRGLPPRALRAQLDGYITRTIDRDYEELGGERLRNPAALRRWLTAYASAIATTASYEKIRDAATGGHSEKPAKTTVLRYLDVLERMWMVRPLSAWSPSSNRLARLVQSPKHALVDPALAGRLLGVTAEALVRGTVATPVVHDGGLFGALFEAQVALDLRVYAQELECSVGHFRTQNGDREVDLVISRGDGRVVLVEVKLARTVTDADTRHLAWLSEKLGDEVLDAIVVCTGPHAYRRSDGIGVVPLALLGL
jgi:predicted AAA+ superfamily ATPase